MPDEKYTLTIDSEKIRHLYNVAPKITRKEVGAAVKKSSLAVMKAIMQTAPVDRGLLRQSVSAEISESRGLVKPEAPYAEDVEFGRKPPVKITPKERVGIMAWAKRKNLNPYAVLKSIARKGTKKNPFVERGFKRSRPQALFYFDQAIDKIAVALAKVKL